MVSFSCEVCNDTVIKKKLDQHRQRCRDAYFSCIDCSTTFSGTDYRNHTQCISEAEKYEKALYKGKETKQPAQQSKAAPAAKEQKKEVKESKPEAKSSKAETKKSDKESKKSKKSGVDLLSIANGSLYKVVKKIASDTKQDKKEVLKKLQVSVDGDKVVLTL